MASRRADEQTTKKLFIHEGDYVLKKLETEEEKTQAYRLRHMVFSDELGWVPRSESQMEIDEYDSHAIPIGILDGQNKLLAFSRLIHPYRPFMLEREFSYLVDPDHEIRKENDTAEVSRLCVSSEARTVSVRGNLGIHSLSMLLCKGIYQWCIRNGVRYIYIVVDYKIYRLFSARGFPCRPVGKRVVMPDGCVAMAANVDFVELISLNISKRPELVEWFIRCDD